MRIQDVKIYGRLL